MKTVSGAVSEIFDLHLKIAVFRWKSAIYNVVTLVFTPYGDGNNPFAHSLKLYGIIHPIRGRKQQPDAKIEDDNGDSPHTGTETTVDSLRSVSLIRFTPYGDGNNLCTRRNSRLNQIHPIRGRKQLSYRI